MSWGGSLLILTDGLRDPFVAFRCFFEFGKEVYIFLFDIVKYFNCFLSHVSKDFMLLRIKSSLGVWMKYKALAESCQKLEDTSSYLEKNEIIADLLRKHRLKSWKWLFPYY